MPVFNTPQSSKSGSLVNSPPSFPKLPGGDESVEFSGALNTKLPFSDVDGKKYARIAKKYFSDKKKFADCKADGFITASEISAFLFCKANAEALAQKTALPKDSNSVSVDKLKQIGKEAGWDVGQLVFETRRSTKKDAPADELSMSIPAALKEGFVKNSLDIDVFSKVALADLEEHYRRIYPASKPDGRLDRLEAAPIAFSPAAASPYIKATTAENFDAEVLAESKNVPVLAFFWAPWCMPCHMIEPVLNKLVTAASGKIKLVKVNIDESDIEKRFKLKAFPTLLSFKDGNLQDNLTGMATESVLQSFIDKAIKTEPPQL